MEDRLSGFGANVIHRAVAIFNPALAPDFGGDELTVAEYLCVFSGSFFQSSEMLLRNDQDVRRGLRIDIFEGKDLVVFIDLLGRNRTRDDFAEEAVIHESSAP